MRPQVQGNISSRNDQVKWKFNLEGQVVNFKAKGLFYIPRVWHHFITPRILPSETVSEVTKERTILNYAIHQDIEFDVGKFIEEAIWENRGWKFLNKKSYYTPSKL